MLLIKLLNKIFKMQLSSPLDLYIQSKNPKSIADVESVTKEYFDKRSSGYFAG